MGFRDDPSSYTFGSLENAMADQQVNNFFGGPNHMSKHGRPGDSGLQNASESFHGHSLETINGSIDGYPLPASNTDMTAFHLESAIGHPDSGLIGSDAQFPNVSPHNLLLKPNLLTIKKVQLHRRQCGFFLFACLKYST